MTVDHAQRRTDVLDLVRPDDLEALLVSNPLNIRYLTGFTGSMGYLLLAEQPTLLVDGRYQEQADQEVSGVDIVTVPSSQLLPGGIADLLAGSGHARIGFEATTITMAQYAPLAEGPYEFVRTDLAVERRRARKDETELGLLREAARLAVAILDEAWDVVAPGRTEMEVAGEIERAQRRAGSEGSAAKLIVASGARTSLPHAAASTKVIGADEPILIDLSTTWDGYRADITRLGFTGPVPDDYARVVEVVKAAQDAALAGIRPGMTAKEVDALMRDHITEAGYGPLFIHAAGHGIGMGQHEIPMFSPYGTATIEPGMVVMLEPGIYVRDTHGARLEDAVVITDTGCELLLPADSTVRELSGSPGV